MGRGRQALPSRDEAHHRPGGCDPSSARLPAPGSSSEESKGGAAAGKSGSAPDPASLRGPSPFPLPAAAHCCPLPTHCSPAARCPPAARRCPLPEGLSAVTRPRRGRQALRGHGQAIWTGSGWPPTAGSTPGSPLQVLSPRGQGHPAQPPAAGVLAARPGTAPRTDGHPRSGRGWRAASRLLCSPVTVKELAGGPGWMHLAAGLADTGPEGHGGACHSARDASASPQVPSCGPTG